MIPLIGNETPIQRDREEQIRGFIEPIGAAGGGFELYGADQTAIDVVLLLGVCTKMYRQGTFAAIIVCLAMPANALDRLEFQVTGGAEDVAQALRSASLLLRAQNEDETDAQDLFTAARAEYSQLLGALYAQGYYSGVIQILVDGREAAGIPALDAPSQIREITVTVTPGPAFSFARAQAAPLAAGTTLPEGFAVSQPAKSGVISEAASAAVEGWRVIGHAKADLTGQTITADHRAATLSADLQIQPGPKLRFGALTVTGNERMRLNRVKAIAGLPEGEVFDPKEAEAAAERLRRSGVFRSVSLVEDADITSPDLLGFTAKVAEEKTRRYGYGAEIASSEGAEISAYWLHRNVFGGAERLRLEATVSEIGAQNSAADYALGVTLERPATLSRDTTGTFEFRVEQENDESFTEDSAQIGIGFSHYFSEKLTARAGLEFAFFQLSTSAGMTDFQLLSLPVGAIWDNRNSKTDATSGVYLDGEVAPYVGFGGTESGVRISLDARTYRGFGENDKFTIAVRGQANAVLGPGINNVPSEFLTFSGGGGTVRGQPFESLSFPLGADDAEIGGTGFLGASIELRARLTKTIGVVGFADFGQIASDGLFGGQTKSHAGAGIGLRYATGLGPIRLDVGGPISGDTGGGVQIYIGIGQAF